MEIAAIATKKYGDFGAICGLGVSIWHIACMLLFTFIVNAHYSRASV